jgi:hypothetical protein
MSFAPWLFLARTAFRASPWSALTPKPKMNPALVIDGFHSFPVSSVVISDYPALDIVPPTDSPEVAQWVLEVQNSGITIPDIPPTIPGGCPTNPNVVTNSKSIYTAVATSFF